MAKILTNLGKSMTVLVNQDDSIYSASTQNNNIIIMNATAEDIEKETNFTISDNNPNPVVASKLTLKYDETDIDTGNIIGFRISTTNTNATLSNYTFTAGSATASQFTIPGTLPNIALAAAAPTAESVIWQNSSGGPLNGEIDIEINYKGTSVPENDNPLEIIVDFYVIASTDFEASDFSNVIPFDISEDTDPLNPSVHNPIQVLVVTATELTSTITSHIASNLITEKKSFAPNNNIVLKNTLTKGTVDTTHKDIYHLTLEESINKAIKLSYLYISTETADEIDSATHELKASAATLESSKFTAIDISNIATTTITGLSFDSTDTSINKLTINMNQITDTAKFFENGNLKSQLYIYIDGTVISAAVK